MKIRRLLFSLLLFACPAFGQAPPAFYETAMGVLDCRNMVATDGVRPSSVTPVISSLEAAMDSTENAWAVLWGISNLGGFGFPAPQNITDPVSYAQGQIAAAQASLSQAQSLAQSLPPSSDLTALLNSDIPGAQLYLQNFLNSLQTGSLPADQEQILFSLYTADYNLSQEEPNLLGDIARDDSSSSDIALGLWQSTDWVRVLANWCFGLTVGYTAWPVSQSWNGYNCPTAPHECAASILLFPGLSGLGQNHGAPYYFRTGLYTLSLASLSASDVVATERFIPRAWNDTEDAGYRASQLGP